MHDGPSGPLGPIKQSSPKRFAPGDDLVEDLATGITGLEAHSTSAQFLVPLFRTNTAHIAARRLSLAVAKRLAQASSSSSSSAYCTVSLSPHSVPDVHLPSAAAAYSTVSPSPNTVSEPVGLVARASSPSNAARFVSLSPPYDPEVHLPSHSEAYRSVSPSPHASSESVRPVSPPGLTVSPRTASAS